MTQANYLKILRWGIYLSFLSILFVFKNLLFPYITSKQIFFNVLIEILFIFWLAFIIKFPNWRPKKTPITIGLAAYFLVVLISSFTGADFNLSFWGDIERMLGFFHLFHFFLFYLIIITVFRTKTDWRNLLLVSFGVAVLACLWGIAQRVGIVESPWGRDRIISTIGNPAYVGGYAVFNIYFALLLFFKEEKLYLKILYFLGALIVLLALIFSGTRGAYLGFGASIFLFLMFFSFFKRKTNIGKVSLASIFVIAILLGGLFAKSETDFVKNNRFFSRLTQISLTDATMQTRIISWKAAWKDFKNHPFLGSGHGNFAIIFDKYFDPKFYNYTKSETYFDRAHNNLVDIASTTGILGLLTYLSVFAAAFYYLIKNWLKNKDEYYDYLLLICLLIAYFIQNLVVFDALVTYISLMVSLGYILWLNDKAVPAADESAQNKEAYILIFSSIIVLLVVYQYNIKPLKMLLGTIESQYAFAAGNVEEGIDRYKKAMSLETVLDRDGRNSLIQLANTYSQTFSQLDKKTAEDFFDYVVDLAEKNVAYNPQDSLMQMQLAQTLNTAASFFADDQQKFLYYSKRAEDAINKSIDSSPGRVPIYFVKSQIFLTRGDKEKAIETLRYSVTLNPEYSDSYCQLAKVHLYYKEDQQAYEKMDKCIDLGGLNMLTPANLLKQLINHYIEVKDTSRVIKLYEQLTNLEDNAQIWANLARLYAESGQKEDAKKAALKAAELDPKFREAADKFIGEVK